VITQLRNNKIALISILSSLFLIPLFILSMSTTKQLNSRAMDYAPAQSNNILSTVVPLNITTKINNFTISGNVKLNSDTSFIRVILVDTNNIEYLVYEAYPLIANSNNFNIENACYETCAFNSIVPKDVKIEGYKAEILNLKTKSELLSQSKFSNELSVNSLSSKETSKVAMMNNQIKKNGLKWVAGETSVSKLSYQNKKKILGAKTNDSNNSLIPNLQGFEYYKSGVFEIKGTSANNTTQAIPTNTPRPVVTSVPYTIIKQWDWRNRHGKNWVSPVKNQLTCGSCWAFAGISTTESAINLYYNQILNIDLSEQDSVCRHSGSCQYGGFWTDTLRELMSTGIVTESCYPYTSNETCGESCPNSASQLWKIKNFNYISSWPYTDLLLKQHVIEKGPIPFVVRRWWHVMTLVGYELEQISGQTIWIVKNSWGTDWGEGGFGKIILPENEREYSGYVEEPYFSSNPSQYQIACTDNDKDRYCNWGISKTKPTSCPSTCTSAKDCDDSNPNLGPFDANYNCKNLRVLSKESPIAGYICGGLKKAICPTGMTCLYDNNSTVPPSSYAQGICK
jgi:C1A family cysteine protease